MEAGSLPSWLRPLWWGLSVGRALTEGHLNISSFMADLCACLRGLCLFHVVEIPSWCPFPKLLVLCVPLEFGISVGPASLCCLSRGKGRVPLHGASGTRRTWARCWRLRALLWSACLSWADPGLLEAAGLEQPEDPARVRRPPAPAVSASALCVALRSSA